MSSSFTVVKTIHIAPGTLITAEGSSLTFHPAGDFVYSIDCGDSRTAKYLQDTLSAAYGHRTIEMSITIKTS